MSTRNPTIFALSSGPGRCGVAVFRISGPDADHALRVLAGDPLPEPGAACLRRLRDPESGDPIDDALVIRFAGPASYTGEDTAELQAHGSPAVARRLLASLGRLPGLRAAEAGEFTRRAFENGKLDLAQIEGLADLIDAETESQRRLALRAVRGEASDRITAWRSRLVNCLAPVEALVDFPEDIGDDAPEGQNVAKSGAPGLSIASHRSKRWSTFPKTSATTRRKARMLRNPSSAFWGMNFPSFSEKSGRSFGEAAPRNDSEAASTSPLSARPMSASRCW